MYIWCKNPEINPPLLPLIVPCNVDSTGYFDPTNSKKKKKTQGKGAQGMGQRPSRVLPRDWLYLKPRNLENIPLPKNYSPPTKIAPKL